MMVKNGRRSGQQPIPEPPSSPIPDGGLQAWLQVLSGFMLFLNSFGFTTCFGVFQQYYRTTYLSNIDNSTISWIGTLSTFMLSLSATFAGPLLDRGHPRLLVASGGSLVVFGLMMTSLCHEYWQLILAQGVCVGIGSGQLFIVATAILPQWFNTKRSTAMGWAGTGSGLGGVVYPIVFHRLIGQIGFGWSVRVIGFIALATCLVSLSITKMRTRPPPRPKIVDFSGFKELPYVLFALVSFFGSAGLYIPFFYITEYSQAEVHGISSELAFYMLPIMGAGSILGRLFPAIAADRFGNINVLALCTAVAGVLAFCWIAVQSVVGVIVWSILYGFFSGTFVSLQVPIVAEITKDPRILGGRAGMNNLCTSIGVLIGNPIAGILVKQSWLGLQAFCGALLFASAFFTVVTRVWIFGAGMSTKA
ncbi:hypothetical protein LTR36_000233 [Oleoguttula mirabilis]|uniref:Major facilitator superfamily (MFS) profile domain-containing protein n=1 Tax=Oleoguttula mirabilis TaxID=1507867 RepID=A0AAV9JYD0_9PEZI|nr:hypothetical protein LTR36_000233 [Oleoguttula mirabilis]